jgi:hypothetical protein
MEDAMINREKEIAALHGLLKRHPIVGVIGARLASWRISPILPG